MQAANITVYEHPLNDHIRICLQFEELIGGLHHYLGKSSAWDHKICLDIIINLLDLLDRADLRSRFSQELHRYSIQISKWKNSPGIDSSRLDATINDIEHAQNLIHENAGKFMRQLRDNEFISHAMKWHKQPGGICLSQSFEIRYWLQQSREQRLQSLEPWIESFDPVGNICQLILDLVRGSSQPTIQVAEKGYFQQLLDPQQPYQLLQVSLDSQARIFPRISFGRHGLSIRFVAPDLDGFNSYTKVEQDIEFKLACCVL